MRISALKWALIPLVLLGGIYLYRTVTLERSFREIPKTVVNFEALKADSLAIDTASMLSISDNLLRSIRPHRDLKNFKPDPENPIGRITPYLAAAVAEKIREAESHAPSAGIRGPAVKAPRPLVILR